jgi:transposase
MYYIGLDVHKRTISYCVKDAAGQVHSEGKIGSTRRELDAWIRTLPQPRMIAMEATIFTGWIYDHLLPHAEKVKVAHPLMLRAIAAAKKKNDRIDAGKIADCLRCDFLPECHMAPTTIRDRRRILRYRNLVIKQSVQMKNRVSGLLMETGVSYNKQRLHKVGYFRALLSYNEEVSDSIRPLLKIGSSGLEYLTLESSDAGIVWDLGTFEVMEASLDTGHVAIYVSGRKARRRMAVGAHSPPLDPRQPIRSTQARDSEEQLL